MKIGLYISELLLEHDSVSLPGLGVFSVQTRPSRFSDDGQVLYPPSRQIHFLPEVRINDGLLLNHLAHRQAISAPMAYLELTGICDDIHYRLDHGEPVILEGLGTLWRTESIFHFEMFPDAVAHPGSFGLMPVRPVRCKGENIGVPLPAEAISRPPKKVAGRKPFFWITMASILVFIAFLFWIIPNITKNNRALPGVSSREQAGPAAGLPEISEPLPSDSLISQDTGQIPEILEPAVTVHPAKGLYYLVGGSFRTRENAEQFFRKMAGKGFEPVHLGEIGSFHVVAISVYTDMGEAARAQSEMLGKDSLSGVWVYYLPGSE